LIKNLSHDLAATPHRDERTRQEFVASLRHHVLDGMAGSMRARYENVIKPGFEQSNGRPPADGEEVHDAMLSDPYFCFYSAVRYNAQQMVHRSVIPLVDRNMEELNERARKLREDNTMTGGSLKLNSAVEVPRSVSSIDVHLVPGSYHSEYADNDTSAGAIYDNSINVFAFNQMGKNTDDIGHTFANFVRIAHPDFKPEVILDVGCTIGHNTVPWAQTFPDAQVTGADIAPALLRYGSARAKSLGVAVDFRQMNCTALDCPDASVDVVFSSMFLHELPLKDIRAYIKEAYRVLKPGGTLWILEAHVPPRGIGHEFTKLMWAKVIPGMTYLFTRNSDAKLLMDYYWDTIDQAASPETLMATMQRVGFEKPRYRMAHPVCEYVAKKPLSAS